MASVSPYLNFSGNCEEAFNFYKSVFGGEFETFTRFKEMPPDPEHPMPPSTAEQIAHVALPLGDGTYLMASDHPEGFGPPHVAGTNFSISVNAGSQAEADKIFNGLSAGGEVAMPMGQAPWGSYFGMFTDKYKINWMVSFDNREK